MKRSKDRLKVLINNYFDQSIKPKELSELSNYVLDEDYQADLEQMFPNVLDSNIHFTDERLEQKTKQNILSHILNYNPTESKQFKKRRLRFYMASTAAVIAAIAFGVWIYNTQYINAHYPEFISGFQYSNDIAPGKNTATLKFADGSIIQLSDAKTGVVVSNILKYNDGTAVKSSNASRNEGLDETHSIDAKPQVLTAITPRGGTYQFTLPDGTKVWLNALSSLKFPSSFAKLKDRKVELIGEAYFEVEKLTSFRGEFAASQKAPRNGGANHGNLTKGRIPFIVITKGQKVEVLGTHFNINAYSDESSTKTTLLEGSVKVSSLQGSTTRQPHNDGSGSDNEIILTPNQQATLTDYNGLAVTAVDATAAISWQSGYFTFNREHLDEIMRKVSRWYDVNVVYKEESIKTVPFSGTITRFSKVSELIKMLELTGKVTIEQTGRVLIVDRK